MKLPSRERSRSAAWEAAMSRPCARVAAVVDAVYDSNLPDHEKIRTREAVKILPPPAVFRFPIEYTIVVDAVYDSNLPPRACARACACVGACLRA